MNCNFSYLHRNLDEIPALLERVPRNSNRYKVFVFRNSNQIKLEKIDLYIFDPSLNKLDCNTEKSCAV